MSRHHALSKWKLLISLMNMSHNQNGVSAVTKTMQRTQKGGKLRSYLWLGLSPKLQLPAWLTDHCPYMFLGFLLVRRKSRAALTAPRKKKKKNANPFDHGAMTGMEKETGRRKKGSKRHLQHAVESKDFLRDRLTIFQRTRRAKACAMALPTTSHAAKTQMLGC